MNPEEPALTPREERKVRKLADKFGRFVIKEYWKAAVTTEAERTAFFGALNKAMKELRVPFKFHRIDRN